MAAAGKITNELFIANVLKPLRDKLQMEIQ